MLNLALSQFHKACELLRTKGVSYVLKNRLLLPFHTCRHAIVYRDLAGVRPVDDQLAARGAAMVELTAETADAYEACHASRSRCYGMKRYIRKGYNGFALVKEGLIIGEIWFGVDGTVVRRDLRLMQIELGPADVYIFDMFLARSHRGQGLAIPFLGAVMHALARKGFARIISYYDLTNTPALWTHRVNGFRNLYQFQVHRVYTLRYAGTRIPADPAVPAESWADRAPERATERVGT